VARALASELGIAARVVEGNVYDAPALVAGEQFDLVFTSYGVLGWLPRLEPWARAVAACLAPGRMFHLLEFHPAAWIWDDAVERVVHPYDGPGEPIVSDESGTYADPSAPIQLRDVGFNHGLERRRRAPPGRACPRAAHRARRVPYDIFPDMEEIAPGRFRMRRFGRGLPLVYGLVARRLR